MVETVASAAKQRLPGLDAMRGYAAVAVLLFHARTLFHAPWLMPSGYLAVDLFFVMSGYVIAQAYDDRLRTMGVLKFLRARVVRFYPLFALGLAFGLVRVVGEALRGHAAPGLWSALGAGLLFIPAPVTPFSRGELSPIDVPAWSLLFELWINVLYALLLPRLSVRALCVVTAVAGACLAVTAIAFGSPLNGGADWGSVGVGCARVAFSFPLGALLYRCRDRLPDLSRGAPFIPVALVALFSLPSAPATDLVFALLGSPLLVIAALRGGAPAALAAYGAATSYALYAVHHPLLDLVRGVSRTLGVESAPLAAAVIAALLLICPMLDRFYDRPLRRWLGASRREASEQGAVP